MRRISLDNNHLRVDKCRGGMYPARPRQHLRYECDVDLRDGYIRPLHGWGIWLRYNRLCVIPPACVGTCCRECDG
jgi:hypothetical protein